MTVQVCVGVEGKCALLGVSELYIIRGKNWDCQRHVCMLQAATCVFLPWKLRNDKSLHKYVIFFYSLHGNWTQRELMRAVYRACPLPRTQKYRSG